VASLIDARKSIANCSLEVLNTVSGSTLLTAQCSTTMDVDTQALRTTDVSDRSGEQSAPTP